MNRIEKLFVEKPNGILSVYFTAGYPHLNDTVEVIHSLEKHGVDMVEVGVPFSDPMADGPVIQDSSTKALKNGMSLKKLFCQLEGIRQKCNIPLVLMGYLNPFVQYGIEGVFKKCADIGIDAIIIPDLPFSEYLKYFKPLANKYGVKTIMLITPETSEDRIRKIDSNCDGFIYMVSAAATTGTRESFGEEQLSYFRRINSMSLKLPRLIGFGISNPTTYKDACANSCGAIVGSLFIKLLSTESSVDAAVKKLIETLGRAN